MKSLISFLVLVLLFAFSPGIAAQQAPMVPADIKKIMEKLSRGEEPTEAEQERLDKWSESMEKAMEEWEKKSPGLGKEGSPAAGREGKSCPEPKLLKNLPTSAPRAEAYLALVKSLAAKYGARAGEAKSRLDAGLQSAPPEVKGGDIGAILVAAQAGSAAAYVTALGIIKEPKNFLAANNLGVILTGLEDYSSALSVLLYADVLHPRVPLVQLNIGWVYYELGDRVNAKRYFQTAAKLSPALAGAHNGLGLLAECEGNHLEAIIHFRDALSNGFSAVGAAAYKAAREGAGESANKGNDSSKPISGEKEAAGQFRVPEPPITEKLAQTQNAKPVIEQMMSGIDKRMAAVQEQLVQASAILRRQNERSSSDPNAIVLNRTFDRQLFLFQDISEMLLGEGSELGQALKTTRKEMEASGEAAASKLPDFQLAFEKTQEHFKRMEQLSKEYAACGDNEYCQKAVQKKMDALKYEMDQEAYRTCLKHKDMLESIYSHQYKGWKAYHDQVKQSLEDYCGFTGPVIEQIWAPTLNEFMNLFREAMILNHEKIALGLGANLPDIVGNIQELDCRPPEPPEPAPSDPGADVKKKEPDCPFKKPFTLKLIVVSMELDCSYVKIEGGEGLVASVKRDFKKHETTIGVGVGAGIQSEMGGIEGKMMIEITGSGDTVSDVAFTSSVSSKLGGDWTGASIEGELGGRISLESGPSVTFDTKGSFAPGGFGAGIPGS